jgi:hypothetical protein
MKIYVASSWRNPLQPTIVSALREFGHDVYDFRHPKKDDDGFTWKQVGAPTAFVDKVAPDVWRQMLEHPRAVESYEADIGHVRWCEAIVYVLPCGRSASFEFGYAMGQGKQGYVVAFDDTEPELMFREAIILTNMGELAEALG